MTKKGFIFKTAFQNAEEKEKYQNDYETKYKECKRSLFTAGYRIYTSIDLSMEQKLQTSKIDPLNGLKDGL